MSTKTHRWTLAVIAVLLVTTLTLLSRPAHASAAQKKTAGSTTSSSCFTCHENLYYLYDMGKSYCLTEHKDRCVNCHEGNAAVMNKDESHLGLIAYPQKDGGAKCQQCHTQDTQTRLAKFASLGGYKTVITADPYTPSVDAARDFPDAPEANQFAENWIWLAGAFVLFGLWLMLVLFSPLKP